MNNFSSKVIYPIVGSIGLTTYLIANNKTFINYRNQKLVKHLQLTSLTLVSEHFQISKTYGKLLTSSIDHELGLDYLSKPKNNLNLEMKCYKGRTLDNCFADILVSLSRTTDHKWNIWPIDKWSVDKLEIQFKDTSKPKLKMHLYESIQYENLNDTTSDLIYEKILKSSNLNLNYSKSCLNNLKQKCPFVLFSIEKLLNDEQKMNQLGKPLILDLKSIKETDENLKISIKLMGTNKYSELFIDADKISKSKYDIKNVGIMYELGEEYMLKSTDLARKYFQKILSFVNPIKNRPLITLLQEINLSKVIEEKLIKNNHALDCIGKPIQLNFDPVKNFNLNNETGQLIINFDGRLNSAQLIVDLSKIKDSDQEKWTIVKSNLKMIWK